MVAISAAFHGAVLVGMDTLGLGGGLLSSQGRQPGEPRARAAPPPSPSCEADVALATGARLMYCATPLVNRDECVSAALRSHSLGLTTCSAVALSTEVELMTPEQVAAIEAEPLLDLITPEQQQAFEEQQAQAVEETFEAEQQRLEQPAARAQVVEITKPNVEAPPDQARYLSEFDSRAERETVARGSTEQMVERPQPRELPATPQTREPSATQVPDTPGKPSERPDAPEGAGQLAMRAPGMAEPRAAAQKEQTPGTLSGSEAPASAHGFEAARGTSDRFEAAREASDGSDGEGGGGGRPLVPNLRPTDEVLERAVGGGSVDHLRNVEEGDFTALNAARWKYATFFNRMKRQVAQNWNPGDVYLRRDPTGNVYGSRPRVTLLQVSLNAKGKLTQAVVAQSSGIDFLDEEAIRAFRAAQPFPNPPQGLVDQQSKLITFTFGFHFEVGQPSGWKIFRKR